MGPAGLEVLAVNAWDEPRSTLQKFAREKELRQRILLNGSGVADDYGISALPSTIFIDRNGIVRNYLVGSNSRLLAQYAKDLMSP